MEQLPYITDGLPGIGGKIREKPGHFIVEEIPLYKPSGAGTHLYITVAKEGFSTREVHARLCDIFGRKTDEIGYAGLKDKHASTIQTFSVYDPGKELDGKAKEAVESSTSIIVKGISRHSNKLRPGHLLGNRFTITITGIEAGDYLQKTEDIAEVVRQSGLPNYYGPQRFGMNQDNHINGKQIIEGNLKVSDRWKRRFLVSAYQSWLCNRYLALRVSSGNFGRILKGDIAKKHETGGMFRVEDQKTEQPRYEAKEISFTAPLYGSRMTMATDESGELENSILSAEGITPEQLGKAGAKGTRRLGRIIISDIELKPVSEGLRLSFFLPKGAFATTLLREFMKDG